VSAHVLPPPVPSRRTHYKAGDWRQLVLGSSLQQQITATTVHTALSPSKSSRHCFFHPLLSLSFFSPGDLEPLRAQLQALPSWGKIALSCLSSLWPEMSQVSYLSLEGFLFTPLLFLKGFWPLWHVKQFLRFYSNSLEFPCFLARFRAVSRRLSQIRRSEWDLLERDVLWDGSEAGNRNLGWLGVKMGSNDCVWKLELKLGLDSQLAENSCCICTYLLCSISQGPHFLVIWIVGPVGARCGSHPAYASRFLS